MSYEDFVAILQLNGIEIDRIASWDDNGQLILEYDNLEDVPDTIEIHDKSGHFEDYTGSIDKDNRPDSNGVVDSGDIDVEQKSSPATHSASSPQSSGASQSASAAEE